MDTQARQLQLLLFLVSGVGILAATTYADTVSISTQIPTTSIVEAGYAGFVEAQQFDPGDTMVLESVVIALTLDFAGTMAIENTDWDYSTAFSLGLAWIVELQRPEETPLVTVGASRTRQGLLDPFDGVLDYSGFSGASFDVDRTGITNSTVTHDAADLAMFTGDGTITLPINASFTPAISVGSTDQYETEFWDIFFDGELFITYNYSVVPEPAWGYVIPVLLLMRRRGH